MFNVISNTGEDKHLLGATEDVQEQFGLDAPVGEVLADGMMATGENLASCHELGVELYSPLNGQAAPDNPAVRAVFGTSSPVLCAAVRRLDCNDLSTFSSKCQFFVASPRSTASIPQQLGKHPGPFRAHCSLSNAFFDNSVTIERNGTMRTTILVAGLVAMFGFPLNARAAYYWVDNINGNDAPTNPGTSESSPLDSIQEAANRATQPGDVVFVQRTTQAYGPFVVKASGSAQNPIQFIGYASSVSDRNNGYGIPNSYSEATGYAAWPTSLGTMPYINGTNRSTATGINLHGHDYVEIRNFYVGNCRFGVFTGVQDNRRSNNCTIKNVFVFKIGPTSSPDLYDGYGISIRGQTSTAEANDNLITNCVVLDLKQA